MKIALLPGLVMLAFVPAQAQILRPEAVNGAVLGGIAGAVIGHNSGDLRHNAWKGAAIGAGAGLIFGEALGNARSASVAMNLPAARVGGPVYRDRPVVHVGVGYGRGPWNHSSGYGYPRGPGSYRHHGYGRPNWRQPVYRSVPVYGYYPGYGYGYPYDDGFGYYGSGGAASSGLLLGALAGGIIGHNSGDFRHNGWRGAAWGAGAGWLLGSIVDARRRESAYAETPAVLQPSPAVQIPSQPAVQSQPQQITIINNYYNSTTPMSAANGLFGR